MILSYGSPCGCGLMFGLLLWHFTHYWHCLSLSACIIYILSNPVQLFIHLRSHNFSLLFVCCDELHSTHVTTNTERDVNINCYNVIKMWGKKYMHPISYICIMCSIYVNLPLVFYMFSFSFFFFFFFIF